MQIPGYTLIKKINSGGMATVYLATQHSVGRTVALKIMKPSLDQDPEFHQRFQREATIIGQLSHPNIIPIYDIGRHEKFNYISMEFLPKSSLDEKITNGITTDIALKITLGIAAALDHAHCKGYVHRDIKPENILFREDDSPVLTDFGIARTIKSKANMTQVGAVIGTPYYMSPEQAKGETSDGRSDLYSLGVVLYEMLTGKRPFHADSSLALGIKHIHEQAPKLPQTLFSLQPIMDKLLAKKPEQRFQTARELINLLEPIVRNRSLLVTGNGAIKSVHLVKTLSNLIVQDLKFFAHKAATLFNKLKNKIPGASAEPTLIASSQLEQTLIASTDNKTLSATNIFAESRNIVRWVYGPLGLVALLILGSVLFGDPSSSSTREQWAQLSENGSDSAKNSSADPRNNLLPLTINPIPAEARVRILNIKEKYSTGIALAPAAYHVEISHPGYTTKTKWIRLNERNKTWEIALQKTAQIANPNQLPLPEMVGIYSDQFLMGDPNSDAAKTVMLDNNFLISRYEITFNEYDFFALATNRSLPDDMGWGRGERPVVNISWDDAIAYANWLSKTTGKQFRLPTAAEWEYAARGNTTSSYWWGNNEDDAEGRANCRYGCKSLWESFFNNKTQPVGSFPPNDFGIHDTAGNVSEWVSDCADKMPAPACLKRAVRGGSFTSKVESITAYSQVAITASKSRKSIGLRLAQEIPSQDIEYEIKNETRPRRRNIFREFSDSIFRREN
ncbi:MAG: bifunctional serine/threonine-protein kinase/formylglycine-generating enzyme family protein [Cellvibrio sp.]|uniref:bifunctional serine/threonine-protein kinase/formylglycine-generating enzyme family protein n=1 Tax=Cellvibrio sp. TaxID=1965322 RepID=UPI00271B008C|nr:bifunctional serine/threonine-protein kinase/formylglycine-generating enzyme family protein [Cellvibrio sp.]